MAYPSTYEYRMMRLEYIRKEMFNGNNREMAEAIGLKETHLSSYISGRARVGAKVARNIEKKLKIRENELDQPIFNGTTYEALLEIKRIVDKGVE
ncbi:helix-turn-helix transcriptional regulator [Vibrio parahaemolyticus]|nr:helix-turn-helix domain-containing protein [Vibrio parahaemolyticus]